MTLIEPNKDKIMFIISVIPFLILDSTLLYAYSIAFIGGWIGYNKSDYSFKYYKSTEEIMENNANDENYGYVLFYVVIVGVLLVITEYTSFVDSNSAFIAMILFTTLVCLFFINLFKEMYQQVYNHTSIETSSSRYVLTSKIAMLFAVSSTLITQELAWYSTISFFVPIVVYLRFTQYLNKDNDAEYSNLTQFESDNSNYMREKFFAQDGYKPLVKDMKYEHSNTDNSAYLKMFYEVELPEDLNQKHAMVNYAKSTHYTYELINSMRTIENTTQEQLTSFEDYYRDVARLVAINVIELNRDSEDDISINFDDLPQQLTVLMINEIGDSEEYSIDELNISTSTVRDVENNKVDENTLKNIDY